MVKKTKFEGGNLFSKTEKDKNLEKPIKKITPAMPIVTENQSISLWQTDFERIELIRAKCRELGYFKCNISQAIRMALRGIEVDKANIEELFHSAKNR